MSMHWEGGTPKTWEWNTVSKNEKDIADTPNTIYKRFGGNLFSLTKGDLDADFTEVSCKGCAFIDDEFACHHMKNVGVNLGCGAFNAIWRESKGAPVKKRSLWDN